MLNLLFISSSSKVERIRAELQPQIKLKIDVVNDFDYGLKDVFEKRPAIVFIQDHIAGVTGESVARHIQMLLGSGAPLFVFLHEGSTKAKPVKGLFEYLIDLSHTDKQIFENIVDTLKKHLGSQWDKVFIPSLNNQASSQKAEPQPLSSEQPIIVSSEHESTQSGESERYNHTESVPQDMGKMESTDPTKVDVLLSNQEQVDDFFAEYKAQTSPIETQHLEQVSTSDLLPGKQVSLTNQVDVMAGTPNEEPFLQKKSPAETTKKPGIPLSPGTESKAAEPASSHATTSQKTDTDVDLAADFVIVGDRPSRPIAPEELLRVFEGNRPHRFSIKKVTALLSAVAIVATCFTVWLIWDGSLIGRLKTSLTLLQPKTNVSKKENAPASSIATANLPYKGNEADSLPRFISQATIDTSYSLKNPGWERYTSARDSQEYRLFRSNGKIKAIQVLNNIGSIDEKLVSSILIEFIGRSDYRVESRTRKDGIDIEQAVIGPNNLHMYRKGKQIKAFVVSKN